MKRVYTQVQKIKLTEKTDSVEKQITNCDEFSRINLFRIIIQHAAHSDIEMLSKKGGRNRRNLTVSR